MKKKTIGIIISIITIIGLVGLITYKKINDYTNIIKLNRGIEIPKKAGYKEIYSKDTGVSFHGDGIRYHVYTYENEDIIYSMLDWGSTINSTIYYNSYTETIYNRIKEINAEDVYHPTNDTTQEIIKYYYKKQEDNSELIIVLDQKEKKLYIFESFL